MGFLQKAALCIRLFPSAAPHKAALCTTHGARGEGWSSGDGHWEIPCRGSPNSGSKPLHVPRCLRAQALPPPLFSSKSAQDGVPMSNRSGCALPQGQLAVSFFFFFSHVMVFCQRLQCRGVRWGGHAVLVWGVRCLAPGKKVQVPGATQPQSPASHLDLALWVGGFALLPSARPPCPLFSRSQSSFEAMPVRKITASHLFPLKTRQQAAQAANQTFCLAFMWPKTGLGASAAAVAGVKPQAKLSAAVVCEQIQFSKPCRISFFGRSL